MADLDALADAIDTARRDDAPVELPLELAQAIAARLAPVGEGGVDLEALRRLLERHIAGEAVFLPMPAILAVLERLARYEGAAPALLQMYEDDPEYAEEWPAIHHLRHVQAGEWNPDCAGCTAEPGQRVERWTCLSAHDALADGPGQTEEHGYSDEDVREGRVPVPCGYCGIVHKPHCPEAAAPGEEGSDAAD